MQYTIGVDTITSSGDALTASLRTPIHEYGAMTLNNRTMDPDDDTVSCGECRNAHERHHNGAKFRTTHPDDCTMPLDGFTMHSDAITTFPERVTMRWETFTVLLETVTTGVKLSQRSVNSSQSTS